MVHHVEIKGSQQIRMCDEVQNVQIETLVFRVSDQPFQEFQKCFIKQIPLDVLSVQSPTTQRLRGTVKQNL